MESNMSEEKCWCKECCEEFDKETLFWKHNCRYIDKKASCCKPDQNKESTEWKEWKKQFVTHEKPKCDK